MGNEASTSDSSDMKKTHAPPAPAPRRINQQNPSNNPEAPPAYDDIFGPGSSGSSQSPAQTPGTTSGPSFNPYVQNGPVQNFPQSSPQQPAYPAQNPPWNPGGFPSGSSAAPRAMTPTTVAPNWQQQEEEQELRMWFSAVDENGDGFLTSEELRQALLNDNWTPFNVDTIKMMLKMFDRNLNDRIEFDEFAGLKRYVQEWKKVFDQYDGDNSGTIDVDELQLAFGGMRYNFSLDFCKVLCRRFSKTAASQINLDAFIYACAMVIAMSKDHERNPQGTTFEQFLRRWLGQT